MRQLWGRKREKSTRSTLIRAARAIIAILAFGALVRAALRHDAPRRVRAALREVGLKGTIGRAISKAMDYGFDVRYGTDTSRWIDVAGSGAGGSNVIHAVGYSPTRAREFRNVLSTLSGPRSGAFVDFGCGKGRVLLLASEFGFSRVVGVEFSGLLCEIARANVAGYRRRRSGGAPIMVIEGDAAEYKFMDDETVLFFFNPFDAVVLAAVLDGVVASVHRRPRRVWIVYNNPRWPEVIECAGFTPIGRHTFPSGVFTIYENLSSH
jgi:SAM-dependent methyltransferase